MKLMSAMLLTGLILLYAFPGLGAEIADKFSFENKLSVSPDVQSSDISKLDHEYRMVVEKNRLIQSGIIGLVEVLSLYVVLFFVRRSSHSAVHIVNASALILIVFGAILLSRFAETDQQLTAPIGILGAIAGYMFGTMNKGNGDGNVENGSIKKIETTTDKDKH